jgi:carbamoyl-phosphate synthase small subunit
MEQSISLFCTHARALDPALNHTLEVALTVPALLALEDGSIFRGVAIGATGEAVGEVVFNTALTGYQEILTDPSYAEQMVTLTYPHIGNVGVNAEDEESTRVWAKALIIRDASMVASNFRSQETLSAYLHRHPSPDPHPAREGRPERLHHGRRQH